MKYEIYTTRQFDKAFKLCQRRKCPMEKLHSVIKIRATNGCLPEQYRPHKLRGFRNHNTWECHIEADWLLVWEQNDRQLTLLMLDTGTHADLF